MMNKSSSFTSRSVCTPRGRDKDLEGKHCKLGEEDAPHDDLPQVLEDVDSFLGSIIRTSDEPPCAQVPDCIRVLPKILDSMIDRYMVGRMKLGHEAEEDKSFLDAVDRIYKLDCATNLSALDLDRTSFVLEKAMSFLEKYLCALLQDPKSSSSNICCCSCDFQSKAKTPKKTSSFRSLLQVQDLDHACACAAVVHSNDQPPTPATATKDGEEEEDEDLPAFSPERVSILNKIATAMVTAGYETECCMAFASFRRSAFKDVMERFGYGSLSIDEIHRMQWELLEGEIGSWNKLVRHCTTVLFNEERRLYDSVFPNDEQHQQQQHSIISQSLFSDLARAVIVHFLSFAQGAVLTKPSAEKLFKFLDMYETLRDAVEPAIADYPERCAEELAHETAIAKIRVAGAAVAMFCDLQNSVKGDNQRIPVPNGAIHPLTRYVMNYLEYACEYRDTLEQVLLLQQQQHHDQNSNSSDSSSKILEDGGDGTPENSPFAAQLMTIMELLNANIESKSKLYRDPALRYVFLMNNGRYTSQKIKGCTGLHEAVGDNWCRMRKSGLRQCHKSYQRETWSKVLQCLNPEGLLQGSKVVSKQLLKERFKCFNAMFEEIHKTQSTWVVSDEQLKSELRVSISALVIPAYRSFFGRFNHHLQSSRHIDKYIKYHPEDIETLIDHFFDGGSASMTRRRA